jgi:hypothetical protein
LARLYLNLNLPRNSWPKFLTPTEEKKNGGFVLQQGQYCPLMMLSNLHALGKRTNERITGQFQGL